VLYDCGVPRSSAEVAAQTRQAIVEEGTRQASLEGLEGLTIGRLAGTLSLSKAGVIGQFRSKQQLQLDVFAAANEIFVEHVWRPVATEPAGVTRLRAICERWVAYLVDCPLPGGCFISTASMEWDGREGPVRDAVAKAQRAWLRVLASDVDVAVRAGELPPGTDPEQTAFQINAIAMGLNQAVQLFGDRQAAKLARRSFAAVL
jgi:AcrR family transcriptional regulator